MDVHWLNLTNGLEMVLRGYDINDLRIMRLQSTWCEQGLWGDILDAIPDEFLFRLALGDKCIVYDYSAKRQIPRSIWQGLSWVRYAVQRRWGEGLAKPEGRAKPMLRYFGEQYSALTKRQMNRLDYYGKFHVGKPRIEAICGPTKNDGKPVDFFLKKPEPPVVVVDAAQVGRNSID